VLPTIGQPSGSRVSVPSGKNTTHSPSSRRAVASTSDCAAPAVPRCTGIMPVRRRMPPRTGTEKSDAFAVIFGARPWSERKCASVTGSASVTWFAAAMKPRAGRFSAPRQSRRVIAKRIGRRKNARILYARGVGGRLGTIPEPTGRSPPSDPAVPPRGVRGLVTVGRAELRRRRRQVVADGAGGEVGARGDLLDGGAVRGELEHVGLARRERARPRRDRFGGELRVDVPAAVVH